MATGGEACTCPGDHDIDWYLPNSESFSVGLDPSVDCAGAGSLEGCAVCPLRGAATRKQSHYKQCQGFCATPPTSGIRPCNKCTPSRGREWLIAPLSPLNFPMWLKFLHVWRFSRLGEFPLIDYCCRENEIRIFFLADIGLALSGYGGMVRDITGAVSMRTNPRLAAVASLHGACVPVEIEPAQAGSPPLGSGVRLSPGLHVLNGFSLPPFS
jgi:hypothetical protein